MPEVILLKQCPAPTPVFTGRENEIAQVEACIREGDRQRCVFVLHGMGGAGKTQIALRTVERTSGMWTDVIYVDASSRETAVADMENFAKAKGVGQTYEDALRWLANRCERWLLFFDNADHKSLGITDLLPRGDHGSVLITTRTTDLALQARGRNARCEVSSMGPKESLELLMKTSGVQEDTLTDSEYLVAQGLVEVRLFAASMLQNQADIHAPGRALAVSRSQ